VYYWRGIYASERSMAKQPFTARRSLRMALREYDAALALQPDDPSVRHGRALVYLALGRSGGEGEALDPAVVEARAALEASPGSAVVAQTLAEAYMEKGEYGTAARSIRDVLSARHPAPEPLSLVAYSPVSRGAGRYAELRVQVDVLIGAAGALLDDEVIEAYEPISYYPDTYASDQPVPAWLARYRHEFLYYSLLSADFLAGRGAVFERDLSAAPEAVRKNELTLLLVATQRLLGQPEGRFEPETGAAIREYLEEKGSSSSDSPTEPIAELGSRDLFYREAGNLLRQDGRYEDALRVYRAWLSEPGARRPAWRSIVEALSGEAHFLSGDYEAALTAFERAGKLAPGWPLYTVRRAFMYEKLGKYEEAALLYEQALDGMRRSPAQTARDAFMRGPVAGGDAGEQLYESAREYDTHPEAYYGRDYYQAAKHLGDVRLIQASSYEKSKGESPGRSRARYESAAEAYGMALERSETDLEPAAAANNLGIALIKTGEYERATEVLGSLVRQPNGPLWENQPTPDPHNPVFRLNLEWAHELNGEPGKAEEQYLKAVRSDPGFYPALNDLGVLAAKEGRVEEAKGYFGAAVEAAGGDYDYALHNLGVALVQSGDFLAGQGYLARAVRQNPALKDASYDYAFDNELYFLNMSLQDGLPDDWGFAERAQRSTFVVSLFAVFLLLWSISRRYLTGKLRETVVGRLSGLIKVRLRRELLPSLHALGGAWMQLSKTPRSTGNQATLLAILVTAPAIAAAQGWALLWEESGVKLLVVLTLVYVALGSLLVHHAGHALMALRFGLRVREAFWPAGIAQAILLAAVGGPFVTPAPATEVEEGSKEQQRQLVYLAGPLASVAFATLLYVVFLISGSPALVFGVTLNLALGAASLLSLPPLEGHRISGGYYSRIAFWATTATTVLSALIAFGEIKVW
jgi:tetratricopeptide (TPR) repeat protein/Zn-dependent protease